MNQEENFLKHRSSRRCLSPSISTLANDMAKQKMIHQAKLISLAAMTKTTPKEFFYGKPFPMLGRCQRT